MLMDILQMVGLGGQVMLAASVGFGAWYLIKFLRIGQAAGSIMASAIRTSAAIAAFLAVGIALGWIDLSIGAMLADLQTGVGVALDVLLDQVVNLLGNSIE